MEFKSHATFHTILDGDTEREIERERTDKAIQSKGESGLAAGDG